MVCGPCHLVKPEECARDMTCRRRLESAVVHQYCEMMLARAVPVGVAAKDVPVKQAPGKRSRTAKRIKSVPEQGTEQGGSRDAARDEVPGLTGNALSAARDN
jgi:hypothetical protein